MRLVRATSALFLAVALSSCGMESRQGEARPQAGGGDEGGGATAVATSTPFERARAVIQARCAGCHTHGAFGRYTEADWIAGQYVVPGAPNVSTLFKRLRGTNLGGTENMPPTEPLPESELTAIADWIRGIPQPPRNSSLPTAQARTSAALAVLRQSCNSCHNVTRAATSPQYNGATVPAFAGYLRDNDFVARGLVTPGVVADSWLMKALKQWGALNRMPMNGPALSAAQKTTLETWVLHIGQP